jgi:hypothetical protein
MLNEWPSNMGKMQTIKKAESLPGSLDRFLEAVGKGGEGGVTVQSEEPREISSQATVIR